MTIKKIKPHSKNIALVIIFDDDNEKDLFFKKLEVCRKLYDEDVEIPRISKLEKILRRRCRRSKIFEGKMTTMLYLNEYALLLEIVTEFVSIIPNMDYALKDQEENIEAFTEEILRLEEQLKENASEIISRK